MVIGRIAATFGVVLSLLSGNLSAAKEKKSEKYITLLLPGMQFNLDDPTLSFGRPVTDSKGKKRWTGMIGTLERCGMRFGGVVRPRGADLTLPKCLDKTGVRGEPKTAKFFVLDYSSAADVDGLAYKTLELAECIYQLKRFTGATKVRLVAYSAGGLVARAYLQNALPRIRFEGDVDRLITIATPHLGSTQAEHFGDFLGTRATCIKPSSELINNLNNEEQLPDEVNYASIVVRGMRIGSRKLHDRQEKLFSPFVDKTRIAKLPLDYQKGSDQVVNVWSQNLAYAKCAREFEKDHKRPVQYVLARVDDPSPDDWKPYDTMVHEVAPNDQRVVELVDLLLSDHDEFWTGLGKDRMVKCVHRQASGCAFGIIEDAMARKHQYSEVFDTKVTSLRHMGTKDSVHQFKFMGESRSKWRLPPRIRSSAKFAGTMKLKIDRFGRVTQCSYDVAKR